MKQIILDGNLLADAAQIHEYLKEMLSFPDYYGKNLDALHDCLTDLEDVEITITPPSEDGAIFQKVLRVFKAADRENESFKLNIEATEHSQEDKMEHEFQEYVTFHVTAKDGSDIEMAVVDEFDFESIIERRGNDALAVDMPADARESGEGYFGVPLKEGFDVIPMWVADMNFAAAPSITQAITERLQHPVFGYFNPRCEYFDAIIKWQTTRNHAEGLTAECIGYENGVLGGVVSAAGILCSQGDKILVHSPTYVGFTNALGNAGYELVHSPLKLDENNVWRMDYEDMEKKLVEQHIHTAILCSPHNPTGRAWERWELEKAMELFKKHDVYVISDEIWSDLYLADNQHIPTQSVSEDAKMRTIAFYAPSKTFNLAGLIGSYHIVYNPRLRDRLRKESSLCHYNSMNVLSMYALIGAYKPEGCEWVEELKAVLTKNVDYACDFIKKNWKGVNVSKPQATYMLFLDCEEWCKEHDMSIDDVQKAGLEVGVLWQDGRAFHGAYCIRMNLALPFSRVLEAFERLDKYVFRK